jgi:4-amino-4-deoxy-L-arabinose transferase-like glycosyltransferase
MSRKQEIFILILIMALAGFFRFWQLDQIPPGLYPDVAMNGINALDALKSGNFKVFYPDNNGREGLFMNLIALSFAVFGPSILVMKVVAAIFGTLTVLGLYLLTRQLFRENGAIALFASFFLATSFWHVNFSRLGFRAIMVPFFSVFAFYFLFKGLDILREKKSLAVCCLLLGGVSFGLGFHTYISFRLAPLILAAIFIPLFFVFRKEELQKKFLLLTSYFLLFTFLVALPIGLYFLTHPADFMGRVANVSIFQAADPFKAVLTSLGAHLAMFNFVGDFNWRHNIAGAPVLFWPVGILFLVGLFYSIRELFFSFQKNSLKFTVYGFLLAFWFVMLLPGILTIEAVPHSLRTIGAIPPTFIFAGLGAALLFEKFWQFAKRQAKFNLYLLSISCLFLAVSFVAATYSIYFKVWAENPEVQGAFSTDLFTIGNYLNTLPDNTQKYVVVNLDGVLVNGLPMPAQTSLFLERAKFGSPRASYVLPRDIDEIKPAIGKTIIVPLNPSLEIFNNLQIMFPQGKVIEQGVKIFII